MTQHLLVAHGSPDPRHHRAVSTLADTLSRRGVPTGAAYLEHDAPSVDGWLEGRSGRVVTLGLFLAPGYHVQVDLPRVLAAAPPDLRVADRGALGVGSWLMPVLDDLVAQVAAPDATVVLVGAGSGRRRARASLERFAVGWARHRGAAVTLAHSPDAVATVAGAHAAGGNAVVVPLLVAPGVLADRVTAAADAAGLPCTPTFSAADGFVDAVARRLTGDDLTRP
jgi:sirohydrochlorin ferrochelatase